MAQDNEPDRFVPCMHCTGDIKLGKTWRLSEEWVWRQCKHPKMARMRHCAMNHDNLRIGNGETWPFACSRDVSSVCKMFEPLKNRL